MGYKLICKQGNLVQKKIHQIGLSLKGYVMSCPIAHTVLQLYEFGFQSLHLFHFGLVQTMTIIFDT